jgi:hypothetical protein
MSDKLILFVLGEWTEIDILNLVQERSQKVLVERAGQEIVNIYDDILRDFPDFHINIIVEKNEHDFFVFPLIDSNIKTMWETLRNKVYRVF